MFVKNIKAPLAGLLMTAVMAGGILAGGPLPLKAGDAGTGVKVVELFTSQGCSSCPPADVVLGSYVKKPDVVALSYSVDYWDYLGWRDTFGSPENSQRQRAYATARGDGAVYTPQAVVNGMAHVNGAQKAAINKQISKTNQALGDKKARLSAASRDGKVIVSAKAVATGDDKPVLWLVRVKDVGKVKIPRGENRGKTLEYHNVVLGVEKLAVMTGGSLEVAVDRKKVVPRKGEHGVFLLQMGSTGPILAAYEAR